MNKAAIQSQHNVNISGGTDKMRYVLFPAVSLIKNGMFKQLGATNDFNFNYDRYNYRANLDFDVTKTTVLSVNIGGRIEAEAYSESDEDQNQLFRKALLGSTVRWCGIVDGKRVVTNPDIVPRPGNRWVGFLLW